MWCLLSLFVWFGMFVVSSWWLSLSFVVGCCFSCLFCGDVFVRYLFVVVYCSLCVIGRCCVVRRCLSSRSCVVVACVY